MLEFLVGLRGLHPSRLLQKSRAVIGYIGIPITVTVDGHREGRDLEVTNQLVLEAGIPKLSCDKDVPTVALKMGPLEGLDYLETVLCLTASVVA